MVCELARRQCPLPRSCEQGLVVHTLLLICSTRYGQSVQRRVRSGRGVGDTYTQFSHMHTSTHMYTHSHTYIHTPVSAHGH